MEGLSQGSVLRLIRLWFGVTQSVNRRAYALSGFGLAIVKYLGDLVILKSWGEALWSPLQYLSPFLETHLVEESSVVFGLWAWAVPFVWIGVSMTARRARDAGLSATIGLLFLIPAVNYLVIGTLLFLKSRPRAKGDATGALDRLRFDRDLLSSVAVGVMVAPLVWSFTVLAGRYSYAMFLGVPFVVGVSTVAFYNRRGRHSLWASLASAQISLFAICGFFLLLGIEGLLCIAMTYPLVAPIVALGSLFAFHLFASSRQRSAASMIVLLPLLLAGEYAEKSNAIIREVVSVIEIDAPPKRVWPNVVAFTELPPPTRWVFRLGIAYPMRAHYVGEGVGATRYCEFSTGPFVEPITAWEAPHRLAFDVIAQPPTMQEWSPYRDLQPPHVTTTLHTRRGEFRLTPLPGGRTRLEGSTWYGIDLYPQSYWGLWSDALIHRIHLRVLEHIREVTEADIGERAVGRQASHG